MAPPTDPPSTSLDPPASDPPSTRDTEPTHAAASRDGEASGDTLQGADVTTTDLSLQHATDPTLLSNTEPSNDARDQLMERLRELEVKHDALLARVRLLEKGDANPLPRPGAWLLFLPLVAFLWWLVQRLQ